MLGVTQQQSGGLSALRKRSFPLRSFVCLFRLTACFHLLSCFSSPCLLAQIIISSINTFFLKFKPSVRGSRHLQTWKPAAHAWPRLTRGSNHHNTIILHAFLPQISSFNPLTMSLLLKMAPIQNRSTVSQEDSTFINLRNLHRALQNMHL